MDEIGVSEAWLLFASYFSFPSSARYRCDSFQTQTLLLLKFGLVQLILS